MSVVRNQLTNGRIIQKDPVFKIEIPRLKKSYNAAIGI